MRIGEPVASVGLKRAGVRIGEETHWQRPTGRLLRLKLGRARPPINIIDTTTAKVEGMHHASTKEPVIALIGYEFWIRPNAIQ